MCSDFDSRCRVIKLSSLAERPREHGAPHLICSPLVTAHKRRRSERYKSFRPAASFFRCITTGVACLVLILSIFKSVMIPLFYFERNVNAGQTHAKWKKKQNKTSKMERYE